MPRREHHSPPRTRAPPVSRPSFPLRLVAAVGSTLPFFFPSTATQLLFPLFSSAPTTAGVEATYPLYLALGAVFLASRFFVRREGKAGWSWRTWWAILGAWKIVGEGVIRLGGEALLGMGLTRGVLVGRALVEAVPAVALWSWLWASWTCKERKAFLPRWWLPAVFLASLVPHARLAFELGGLPFVPECHILQIHGLVLGAVALFAPSFFPVQQSQARTPRVSPPRQKQPKKAPNTAAASPRPPSSVLLPLPLRAGIFLTLLTLAHLTALTSTHCPTSRPSALLSLPRSILRTSSSPTTPPPRILSSRKSLTGWITVGEQTVPGPPGEDGQPQMVEFRYLRADHSLLGGLWVGPSRAQKRVESERGGRGGEVEEREVVAKAETIYSTFLLQELVRLVKPPPDLPRQLPEQGLIIGLGAGLSARALDQHGVNLTLCEIDPAVYDAAREYFGVEDPTRRKGWGEVVLRDAVGWVEEQKGRGKLFDYIIHDVFTGGAVPASLFTLEFWSSLRPLLHPSGVFAVNFASSLSSPTSKLILSTLLASFAHCRAFEDVPVGKKSKNADAAADEDEDADKFKNLVVFCTASWFLPVEFRDPSPADYLPHGPSPVIRRRVFDNYQAQEVDLARFRFDEGGQQGAEKEWKEKEKERWMFRRGMERRVEREQVGEVRMHWAAMEGVLPKRSWAEW
ncbi:hypothetical protein JCM6882_006180 [Rhodosporidiobolus microsporus]